MRYTRLERTVTCVHLKPVQLLLSLVPHSETKVFKGGSLHPDIFIKTYGLQTVKGEVSNQPCVFSHMGIY